MSIKSGELIHVGNQVLVDRAQTAGPGSLNIPQEHIYELGNYLGVGIVRDTPDLKFTLESYDASAALECILTGTTFAGMADGTAIDISNVLPLDVASQFKAGKNQPDPFEVEASVAIPYVLTDSLNYKFGLKSNASQTASLSGDSIYMVGGSAYIQAAVGTATAGQAITLSHTALPYTGDTVNGTRYALSVTIAETGQRLIFGTDYTETATTPGSPGPSSQSKTVVVHVTAAVPSTQHIRVIYQSDVKASYPQVSAAVASAVKPAAIRGRDIEIRVGGFTLTDRWSSVQNVDLTWSVKLERDEEFGNQNVIDQDFEVPDVKGSVELKPRNVTELMTRVKQIAGITDDSIVGAISSVLVSVEIILHSPYDGSVLKTLYVPDARFTLPGFQGKVQSKLTVKFDFESDSGVFVVYKGAKP